MVITSNKLFSYFQSTTSAFTVVLFAFLVCTACMLGVQARPQDLCSSCCQSQWSACMTQCETISSCYDCSMEYNNCTAGCPGSCQIWIRGGHTWSKGILLWGSGPESLQTNYIEIKVMINYWQFGVSFIDGILDIVACS